MMRGTGTLTPECATATTRSASNSVEPPDSGVSPIPVIRTRLYRAGLVEKNHEFAPAQENDTAADLEKPEGRVGRSDGIFCVASLPEVAMWSRSNAISGPSYNPEPKELFYNGPEPWVYPVNQWHAASMAAETGQPRPYYTEYWSHGLLLSEYRRQHSEGTLSRVWRDLGGEILIDPALLSSHRPVSLKRLVDNTPDCYKDVEGRLKRWRS